MPHDRREQFLDARWHIGDDDLDDVLVDIEEDAVANSSSRFGRCCHLSAARNAPRPA